MNNELVYWKVLILDEEGDCGFLFAKTRLHISPERVSELISQLSYVEKVYDIRKVVDNSPNYINVDFTYEE